MLIGAGAAAAGAAFCATAPSEAAASKAARAVRRKVGVEVIGESFLVDTTIG